MFLVETVETYVRILLPCVGIYCLISDFDKVSPPEACHGSEIPFRLLLDFCGFGRSGRPKGSTNAWGCTIVTRTPRK
jgi:hypothetical protein